jgi:PDZ domain-containing secreted protein
MSNKMSINSYMEYEFIRRVLQKKLGDSVHITLKKHEGKREIVIPNYIAKILNENYILNELLN